MRRVCAEAGHARRTTSAGALVLDLETLTKLDPSVIPDMLAHPRQFAALGRALESAHRELDPASLRHLQRVPKELWSNLLEAASRDQFLLQLAKRKAQTPGGVELDDDDERNVGAFLDALIDEASRADVLRPRQVGVLSKVLVAALGICAALPSGSAAIPLVCSVCAGLLNVGFAVAGLTGAILDFVSGSLQSSRLIAVGLDVPGGGGGSTFHLAPGDVQRLKRVAVHLGWRGEANVVTGLSVDYAGSGGQKTFVAGAQGGSAALDVRLSAGDELVGLAGRAGNLIEALGLTIRRADGSVVSFVPVGGTGGKPFELALPGDAPIRGFVGRAGAGLDALALLGTNHSLFAGRAQCAPFFDKGIVERVGDRLSFATRLTAIHVAHDDVIDAIQAEWVRDDQERGVGLRHGGGGGTGSTFSLEDDETLALVEGATGWHQGADVITRLRFTTSKGRQSPQFGRSDPWDTAFAMPVPRERTPVGFYGFSGRFLDGLGLCVR